MRGPRRRAAGETPPTKKRMRLVELDEESLIKELPLPQLFVESEEEREMMQISTPSQLNHSITDVVIIITTDPEAH